MMCLVGNVLATAIIEYRHLCNQVQKQRQTAITEATTRATGKTQVDCASDHVKSIDMGDLIGESTCNGLSSAWMDPTNSLCFAIDNF